MDLEDVRVFLQVARLGSFTKAAKLLNLPKSTVSRRVSDLENEFDTRLLHRTTRRLSLTEAGQLYFKRTAHILDELKDAQLALEEMRGEPSGLLRVTAPDNMAGPLAAMVHDFRQKFPKVKLLVFATGRRVDLVAEGYDVAIRAGVLSDSSLISKKLLSTQFGLVASPAYLESRGAILSPDDLAHHDCLLFSTEATHSIWRLHGPLGSTEQPVSGGLASNDLQLLKSAAGASLGVALLPLMETHADIKSGRLVRVLPEYAGDENGIYAVYPSSQHVPPRVRAFIDFAAEWMANEYRLCSLSGRDG